MDSRTGARCAAGITSLECSEQKPQDTEPKEIQREPRKDNLMSFNFNEPGALEYINPEQVAGQLLIVWPIQHVNPAPPTKFSRPDKVDDAIAVDVVTLDQMDENGKPKIFRSQLWRQSRLIQSFRQAVGQGPLLGTIGKGTATMGNPPWIFISLTHEAKAVERANAWGQANPDFKPSEPREYVVPPPQQQAPQQGYGQQYGQQPYGQQPQGGYYQEQQQSAHHGAPEAMPQWAQSQQAPQHQTPPLPPQPAGPQQQSILQRLAQQHQNPNHPVLDDEAARRQYGY